MLPLVCFSWHSQEDKEINYFSIVAMTSTEKRLEASVLTYNELSVLLLEALVPLPQLIGHQLVLVPFLLARVQFFGQNQQSFLLTLQLTLADNKLCGKTQREQQCL